MSVGAYVFVGVDRPRWVSAVVHESHDGHEEVDGCESTLGGCGVVVVVGVGVSVVENSGELRRKRAGAEVGRGVVVDGNV